MVSIEEISVDPSKI